MFDRDEDKLIYLAGCALTGTASAPADIGKITKQAYGIAEEMLILINKLKQTPEQSLSGQPAAAPTVYGQSVGTSGQGSQAAGSAPPDQPITGPLSPPAAAAASESKTLVVAKAADDQKSAGAEKLVTEAASANNHLQDFEIARESMKPALASKELAAKELDGKEITAKVAAAKESIAKELAAKAAAGARVKEAVSGSGNGKVDSGQEAMSVPESARGEELSKTHDKGWNYTPWGRS